MSRRFLLSLAAVTLPILALGAAVVPSSAESYRVSEPVVHENLAIYFIRGPSVAGPAPLSLHEGMAKGSVRVYETSNVNTLAVENLGNEEIFIQSGDIVKGGKQDRVLMVSLVLPALSGRVSIASFCVEQGRWTARGQEDAKTFSSSEASMPSRAGKLAMKAPVSPPTSDPRGPGIPADSTGSRQQAVWGVVAAMQGKLSDKVGGAVAAPQSRSSLQLALENQKLKAAVQSYIAALSAAGEKDGDIVGYVFAINGKLNSAEVYPSNALFRKMWPKLLAANASEAISEKDAPATEPLPAPAAVLAFLEAAERGTASEKPLTTHVKLETRDGDKTLYFETRRADGGWVHRNYLAK